MNPQTQNPNPNADLINRINAKMSGAPVGTGSGTFQGPAKSMNDMIAKYGPPPSQRATNWQPSNEPYKAPEIPKMVSDVPAGQPDWSAKKLFAPTVNTARNVANILTSSERKLGGIIGDTRAALTGGIESAQKNVEQQNEMFSRVRKQIIENKAQGKDTSHLEFLLNNAQAGQKGVQQQVAEAAPGSQATNEEALGAIGGTALDILTSGTYGAATKGLKAGQLGKSTPTVVQAGKEALTRGSKGFWEITKEGLKAGAKASPIGAAYGAASGMQDRGDVGDVASSAGIGAGIAFTLPVIGAIAQGTRQKFKPTVEKGFQEFESGYDNMFGRTQTSRKAQNKAAKFDNDPTDLLMQKVKTGDRVPIATKDVAGTTVWDTTEGVNKLKKDVQELSENILHPMLQANPTRVPLDSVKDEVRAKLQERMGDSGDFDSTVNYVNSIIDKYKTAPNFQKGALTLDQLSSIKSQEWGKNRAIFAKDKLPFQSDGDLVLAETIKDIIERSMPEESQVHALNKFIGHHLETINQLEKINGAGVGAQRMGKNFLRTIGAIAGGGSGGTPGAIGGAMAGDEMSKILGQFEAQMPFASKAIEDVKKTNPALINELIQFLPQYAEETAGKVALPQAGKFGVVDLSGGKPANLANTPTKLPIQDVEAQQEAQWAQRQAEKASRVYKPTGEEALSASAVANKAKEVSDDASSFLNTKWGKRWAEKNGSDASALAAMPFGLDQDEDGNIQYNPESAAAGIIGILATKKLTAAQRSAVVEHINLMEKKLSNIQNETVRKTILKAISHATKLLKD